MTRGIPMFNKKKAKAQIVEIVSCNRRESVFRDYYAEDLADHYSPYRNPRERWSSCYGFNEWEHEDNMEDYSRRHVDYHTRRNEWTGEMELHREYVWFEIKLKIKYTVSNVTYEKEIDIQSQTSTIREVRVYYEKKNPERIVDVAYR